MYIVYDEKDFVLDKVHKIDKDVEYVILDVDNNTKKTIKGSSLLNRLNRDKVSNNYSFQNVNYMSKPMLYFDMVIETKSYNTVIDIFKGVISNTADFLNISINPIRDNNGCIIVNDLVINLASVELPEYESNMRFKPYRLRVADCIDFNIVDDCMLMNIQFQNVEKNKSCVTFDFVLNIFDTVHNSYETHSLSYHAIINFTTKFMSINNKRVKLPVIDQLKKRPKIVKELTFDKYSKLSNYYGCVVKYDGRSYLSSESAYQSMKTMNKELRNKFSNLNPDEAKQLGKKIESSLDFRTDWNNVKYNIMHEIVLAKFKQNEDCKQDLFRTKGFLLVEDTTGWCDKVWGRCYCENCKGKGNNHLGKILTEVRKELGCNE